VSPDRIASPHPDHQLDDHDRGLAFDLETLFSRRRLLVLVAGTGAAAVMAACGGSDADAGSEPGRSTSGSAAPTTASSTATGDATAAIPEETAGPYPGDGSNGPDVLAQTGVVRSDIRSSFGSSTTTAEGIPLSIRFVVTDASTSTPLPDAAVYVWHCDREGRYSMYSDGVTDENYLRGVQQTDATGTATFTSIFPAAYSGRWPHIHFEIYASVADATSGVTPMATSQIALPEETCDVVYATTGYERSVRNMEQLSLATDMVFRDGWEQQLGTIAGDVTSGLDVSLAVPV
jgi:protocatechuate 3,4-dioxygenase beta subunit